MFVAFPARRACDTRSPTASGSVRKTRPSSSEMPKFSRRVDASEIMDDLGRPDSEFDQAYRELEIINRRLGGIRAIQRFLPSESNLLMLDVAAGACDVSEALLGRMRARIVVLDVNPKGLEFARRSLPVRGDALELPFSDDRFDVVMASLFFHHLSDANCVRVLENMWRGSRRLLLVKDFDPYPVASLAICALG